ncbi:carbonate dehydratase [Planoprotostelium fungivorum]|uniref:Carbonic anhydrase n=1 Tax=Planoprotostelium fungivorum TaxID=1890364 RepID=A0A2P6NA01_9EUKA|nr:carbonate dehydratase [Planoprotostelium fungivorum]
MKPTRVSATPIRRTLSSGAGGDGSASGHRVISVKSIDLVVDCLLFVELFKGQAGVISMADGSNSHHGKSPVFGRIRRNVHAGLQEEDEPTSENFRSVGELFRNNRKWSKDKVRNDPEYFSRLAHLQKPKLLWIGCSDSRVPANQIIGLAPGQVFVHRNIANVVTHTDVNVHSVIQYAVEVLKVEHIAVVGHYGCGGVVACTKNNSHGFIDWWLRSIKEVYETHKSVLSLCKGTKEKEDRLVELNVVHSALNVSKSHTVQSAWANGQKLSVHAWCYGLEDGLLVDLDVSQHGISDEIDSIYHVHVDDHKIRSNLHTATNHADLSPVNRPHNANSPVTSRAKDILKRQHDVVDYVLSDVPRHDTKFEPIKAMSRLDVKGDGLQITKNRQLKQGTTSGHGLPELKESKDRAHTNDTSVS